MTYSAGNTIVASDFNTFVGNSTSTTTNTLNTIWGIGVGNAGYGQTVVPQVNVGNIITATDWSNLLNTTTTIASQQNTTLGSIVSPGQGLTVTPIANLATNLSTTYTNRLNAAAQGTSSSTTTTRSTTWSSAITFTHTVTFEGANQARYFFNAGGQLAITFNHAGGTGINSLFNTLSLASGTIVLSAPVSTNTVNIAGTSYTGTTKIGGSGSPANLTTSVGYYSLTSSDQLIFKQLGSGTPSGYTGSYISVNVRSNGANVSGTGDAGSIITITTLWDEVPNGLTVATGTNTTVTVRPPVTTYLNKSWGNITVTGSVTGT
jgi:hypothetical protein